MLFENSEFWIAENIATENFIELKHCNSKYIFYFGFYYDFVLSIFKYNESFEWCFLNFFVINTNWVFYLKIVFFFSNFIIFTAVYTFILLITFTKLNVIKSLRFIFQAFGKIFNTKLTLICGKWIFFALYIFFLYRAVQRVYIITLFILVLFTIFLPFFN